MKWDEQANRLRRKAAQDEQAMSILLDVPSAPDEVIGFHAQQAVEFRYEDIPVGSAESLDRQWVAECVERVKRWVDRLLTQSEDPA